MTDREALIERSRVRYGELMALSLDPYSGGTEQEDARLIKALGDALEAEEWQPMETAPTNGTPVIVHDGTHAWPSRTHTRWGRLHGWKHMPAPPKTTKADPGPHGTGVR